MSPLAWTQLGTIIWIVLIGIMNARYMKQIEDKLLDTDEAIRSLAAYLAATQNQKTKRHLKGIPKPPSELKN